MMKRSILTLLAILALAHPSRGATPKLIVAIAVDQLTYDYLDRFHELFSTNGFRLFTDRGSFMTFAHYNYMPTVTGPGHASYLSGSIPAMHGVIGNDWLDRNTGREVYCVEDQSVDGVGATPGKARMSPKNFIGSAFADELRLRFRSKVVGVSIKDRSAVLPAGKKPTGAYWFHYPNGNFVTSTYYRETLPDWVREFNERKRPASFVGQAWERLLDKSLYPFSDSAAGEGTLADEKEPVFNHKIASSKDGFESVVISPFGDQLVAEFAEAAVRGEGLGKGSSPDLLAVSFSSLDSVGHRFGPYSHEVQDMVLRLDRQLEQFFGFLDREIGLEHVAMVLTADHGVAPTPEFAKSQGLDGTRVDEGEFLNDLKARLADEFGPGKYLLSSKIFAGNLYLNHATLERKNLDAARVTGFLREVVLASGKYQACFTRQQLLDGRAPGLIGALALNGYSAERGGDLFLVPKPYSMPGTGKTGTTHGSPYAYDTHIPVLFYGTLFKSGRYAEPFTIADIVPTLCVALKMQEPAGSTGRPLLKVLAEDR